jgi:hypothetical protein
MSGADGQLDIDRCNAMTRLDPGDEAAYQAQDVSEVWFAGSHSDIGSGNLTLRWMLGEAANVQTPVLPREPGCHCCARLSCAVPLRSRLP